MQQHLSADPVLLERNLPGHARLWAKSIRQARRLGERPDAVTALRTRVASLGRIRDPIFVIGSPRSGTTLLGSLLAALPERTYFFEPPLFKYHVRLHRDGRVSPRTTALTYRAGLHLLLLAAPGTGARLIEKNPNHAFLVAELQRIFSTARFVVITRDGRDVATSLREKPWHRASAAESGAREPGGYRYGPWPHFYIEPDRREEFEQTTDLHRCIWIWRAHQEAIEHLRDDPTIAQCHVRYEALVTDPREALAPVLDFIDVGPAGRRALHSGLTSVRSDSVGRWKHALDADEVAVCRAEAGPLLGQLGYG